MKLEYGISFAEFRSLYAPTPPDPRRRGGLRLLIALCGGAVLGGVSLIVERELIAGAWFAAIGVLGMAACYFAETQRIRRARTKYEQDILLAYSNTHCVDHRTFEANDEGYCVTCRCGSVSRLWTGLQSLSENAKVFGLIAKTDSQVIPKCAFASDGAVTEFRAFISQHLNSGRPFTAPSIEFTQGPGDLRAAFRLHVDQGGGWRRSIRPGIFLLLAICGLVPLIATSDAGPWIAAVLGGVILAVVVLVFASYWKRLNRYWGPLRIYVSDEGLYIHDAASEARLRWEQYLGYLEDDNVFLLYQTPKLYRIIPKRAFAENAAFFEGVIRKNLQMYDYRQPFASVTRRQAQTSTSSVTGSSPS
jgi:hypothetical protein